MIGNLRRNRTTTRLLLIWGSVVWRQAPAVQTTVDQKSGECLRELTRLSVPREITSNTGYWIAALESHERRRQHLIEARILYLREAITARYPQSTCSLLTRGGESFIFRLVHRDGRRKVLKLAVDPSRERVQLAFVEEAELSYRVHRRGGDPGARHIVRIEQIVDLRTRYGLEKMLVLPQASEGTLGAQLKDFADGKDPLAVLRVWKQVALGVRTLHRLKVAHRDIKPQNILVNREQNGDLNYIVADFGLSKPVDHPPYRVEELFSGTLTHMSENQMRGGDPRLADDLRGLQVTFMEMLCGRSVFSLDHRKSENHISLIPVNELGTIHWISKLPEFVSPALHPGLRSIAETTYADIDSLLRAINECEERIKKENPSRP